MATNTIREQIILAIIAKLADVRTAKGYNTEAGLYVNRAQVNPDWDDKPFLTVFPREDDPTQSYDGTQLAMIVDVVGAQVFGATNPSVVAELLLGDVIECMTGTEWTMAFTGGGTYVPITGYTITGATSEATGYIETVTLSTGSWAGGDAAGTFTLRRQTGLFEAENLDIGANLNVATIAAAPTGSRATVTTTGDLADRILYAGGGVAEYPAPDEKLVGINATFQIAYNVNSGDPYHQP